MAFGTRHVTRALIGTTLVLAAVAPAIAAAPAPPTLAELEQSLDRLGPKQTVDRLWADDRWDAMIAHLRRGEAPWIALAPRLAPGTDAGPAEDLGIALAYALPHAAPAVLAALDPGNGVVLGVDRVCGRPFIKDTEPKGYDVAARAALTRVWSPRLQEQRKACLAALARADRLIRKGSSKAG